MITTAKTYAFYFQFEGVTKRTDTDWAPARTMYHILTVLDPLYRQRYTSRFTGHSRCLRTRQKAESRPAHGQSAAKFDDVYPHLFNMLQVLIHMIPDGGMCATVYIPSSNFFFTFVITLVCIVGYGDH